MKAATKEDWQDLKALSADAVTVPLGLSFDDSQMENLRHGFIPPAMEYKWFSYFEDGVLHMHRSWSGYKVAEVVFEKGSDGWIAPAMRLAMDPEYFSPPQDEARDLILDELAFYASGKALGSHEDGFAQAFNQAAKPNYLGSPAVVLDLLSPFFRATLTKDLAPYAEDLPTVSYNDVLEENKRVTAAICGADTDFHGLEIWRTEKGLGKNVIRCFGLDADWFADENLTCIVSEGLSAVSQQISKMVESFVNSNAPDLDELIRYTKVLQGFVASVLMGSDSALYPNIVLSDFTWENVGNFVTQDEEEDHNPEDDEEYEDEDEPEPVPGPSTHPRRDDA